jgi:hypothetical protein
MVALQTAFPSLSEKNTGSLLSNQLSRRPISFCVAYEFTQRIH